MKRIKTSDRAVDFFGPGKDGFREQVPGVSQATQLSAIFFNHVQEALVRTIEAAGLELSEADYDQFPAALIKLAKAAADTTVTDRVHQSGGIGQIPGEVFIGAAAIGKLKATVAATDLGNFAFEDWVTEKIEGVIQDMGSSLNAKERKFDTGTRMLFAQTAAPVGWVKVLDHNDAALRVVSGAAGAGGTIVFSEAFVSGRKVSGIALSVAQMPAHTHAGEIYSNLLKPPYNGSLTGTDVSGSGVEQPVGRDDGGPMQSVGGGEVHDHTINFDVSYVDVIIARKI